MDRRRTFIAAPSYLDTRYSEEHAPHGGYPDLLARRLLDHAYGRPGRLLDVGSGRGDHLDAFARLGFEVVGVDVSPRSAELADAHRVETIDLDHDPLPFPPGSFDFVFSKSVVEHLHDPAHMLAQVREALVPGGVAVVMTPSWKHTYRGSFYYEYSHVTPFTLQSLTLALQYAGFDSIRVEHFRQLPFLWRWPALLPVAAAVGRLPLPYRPYSAVPWPRGVNTFVRFAKEVMLLAVARNPG